MSDAVAPVIGFFYVGPYRWVVHFVELVSRSSLLIDRASPSYYFLIIVRHY